MDDENSKSRFVRITHASDKITELYQHAIARTYRSSLGKEFSSVLIIPSPEQQYEFMPYHPRKIDILYEELESVPLDTQPPAQVDCAGSREPFHLLVAVSLVQQRVSCHV